MRYLGLDYGSKTLGVALSDETGTIASILETVNYSKEEELLVKLKKIIEEYNIKEVVLGLPLNLNGSNSARGTETIEFKRKIESHFKVKVHLQDERMSTLEAEKVLLSANMRRSKRKKVIDGVAAVIILQSFLDKTKGRL